MFKFEKMESVDSDFLKNCSRNKDGEFNPFHYDLFNMGKRFDKDHFIMFRSHSTETFTTGYIVNVKTGERQRLVKI